MKRKKSKPKFIKTEIGICFVDEDGREWFADNLQDLVDAIKSYNEFLRKAQHYA